MFSNYYFQEAFDTKVDFKRKDYDEIQEYEFQLDNMVYQVYLKNVVKDIGLSLFEISFVVFPPGEYGKHSYEITGQSKNPLKIFSAVINILKDWIQWKKPIGFFFSAKEDSRIKLYNKFKEYIEKTTQYKFDEKLNDEISNAFQQGNDKYYTFTNV